MRLRVRGKREREDSDANPYSKKARYAARNKAERNASIPVITVGSDERTYKELDVYNSNRRVSDGEGGETVIEPKKLIARVFRPSLAFIRRVSKLRSKDAVLDFIKSADSEGICSIEKEPEEGDKGEHKIIGAAQYKFDKDGQDGKAPVEKLESPRSRRKPSSLPSAVPIFTIPSVLLLRERPKAKNDSSGSDSSPRDKGQQVFVPTEVHRKKHKQLRNSKCMSEVIKVTRHLGQALDAMDVTKAILILTYLNTLCLTHEMIQISDLGAKLARAWHIGSKESAAGAQEVEALKLQMLNTKAEELSQSCKDTITRSVKDMVSGNSRAHKVLDILMADAAISVETEGSKGRTTSADDDQGLPINEAEVFKMVLADQERETQGGFPTDKWRSFAQSKVGRAGTSVRSKL